MVDLDKRFAPVRNFIIQLLEPLQLLLIIFCVVLLCLAAERAFTGQFAGSTAFMGVFLVALMTLLLPRLKVLEAFGVKAELSEQIRKAEITIEQFKILARSSARQGFLQLESGPARHAALSDKQAMVEALNASMDAAGLTEDEAFQLRRPLLDAIADDLRYPVEQAASRLKQVFIHETEKKLRLISSRVTGAPDPNEAERTRLEAVMEGFRTSNLPWEKATPERLSAILDAYLAEFRQRTGQQDPRLMALAESARRLMQACQVAKTVTLEADEFARTVHRPIGHGWSSSDDTKVEALLAGRFAA